MIAGLQAPPAPAANSAAASYGWPIKPCNSQHAVRGHFGAPRTIFTEPLSGAGLDGAARVSFHNGIDIVAPDGTDVFAVVSGTVRWISGGLAVQTEDNREFRYQHVTRAARPGQRVVACQTLLGQVKDGADHLHLVEVARGELANPLSRGHLTPYRDRTRPHVDELTIDGEPIEAPLPPDEPGSRTVSTSDAVATLRGRARVAATAYDLPPFPIEWPKEWAQMRVVPLTPASLTLSLRKHDEPRARVRLRSRANFGVTAPDNEAFWRVYARGTHQNWPVIGGHYFARKPGVYRLRFPRVNTRELPNGVYVLKVRAADTRRNYGSFRALVRVQN